MSIGGFAGFWQGAGRAELALLFPGSCLVGGERAGRVKDRAGPGRAAVPEASLRRTGPLAR